MEFVLVHHPTETKVGNHNVGVFVLCAEQKILWLEVCPALDKSSIHPRAQIEAGVTSVHDAAFMNIFHSGEDGADELGSVTSDGASQIVWRKGLGVTYAS